MGVYSFPKTFTLVLLLVLIAEQVSSQITVTDSFADSEFTSSPAWVGTTPHFIVNPGQELQLNNPVVSTSQLTTSFEVIDVGSAVWEFSMRLTFAPSSGSFARVYLMSDQENLFSNTLNGYFLQFGEANATDAIQLFRQTGNSLVSVCRGTESQIAASVNARVRVTRTTSGSWELLVDYSGGNNFIVDAVGLDSTHITAHHFGVRCTYAATNGTKFFFDNINVSSTAPPDVISPTVTSLDVISSTVLELQFSEPIDTATAENVINYTIDGSSINPTASAFYLNQQIVRLTFAQPFPNGVLQSLTVTGVSDVNVNVIALTELDFLFFDPVDPNGNDIVITELFPDPLPTIGLPESEFVELLNRSASPFDLAGWKITDGVNTATLGSFLLLPGNYVTVTSNAALNSFSQSANLTGVAVLPSLNNAGDVIWLKAPNNITIDSVIYNLSSYGDEDKGAGGWTLERIDPHDFCSGAANWRASEDSLGGSPGRQNSVFQIFQDSIGPRILSAIPLASGSVELVFDEPLNAELPLLGSFQLVPETEVAFVAFGINDRKKINLGFTAPLDSTIVYNVMVDSINDCRGNALQEEHATAIFQLDAIRPEVDSLIITSSNTLAVYFSERMSISAVGLSGNYLLNGVTNPQSVQLHSGERHIDLVFLQPFENGVNQILSITAVVDRANNLLTTDSIEFLYFMEMPTAPNDIIVTEIFADPVPVVGLPEAEFIEVYNRSTSPVDLKGWKLRDGTSTTTLTEKILLPGQYLILCSKTNLASYDSVGQTLEVTSFPALNNTGERIVLLDEDGQRIDSIQYKTVWYQDDEKKDGGFTLERIDLEEFCYPEANWKASNDPSGGTPGRQNSVNATFADSEGPKLISISVSNDTIAFHLSENVSTTALPLAGVSFIPSLEIDTLFVVNGLSNLLNVVVTSALDSITSYETTLHNLQDCRGNLIQQQFSTVNFKLDNVSPFIDSNSVVSANELEIIFSEPIDESSIQTTTNFVLLGTQNNFQVIYSSATKVRIVFEFPMQSAVLQSIHIQGIRDLAQNLIASTEVNFLYFVDRQAKTKDVVITEIFADPTPQVGLPDGEYIELLNRSEDAFSLKGWTISDGTATTTLDSLLILPNQYVILCSPSKKLSFDSLGLVLGVTGFPSLNNAGEKLVLRDKHNNIIDSLIYSSSWYKDSEKNDGGWSLERIDPDDFCSGAANWASSIDVRGGSPGIQNSIYAHEPDVLPLKLVSADVVSADTVNLVFGKRLHEELPASSEINISPYHEVSSVDFSTADRFGYQVVFTIGLDSMSNYSIVLDSIFDCASKLIQAPFNAVTFRLDSIAPSVDSVLVLSNNSLRVYFSEKLEINTLTTQVNFHVPGLGNPDSIHVDEGVKFAQLYFDDVFINGVEYIIQVQGVADNAMNEIDPQSVAFRFFVSMPTSSKDVLISEIFADPTPTMGLPEHEFVELFNRSDNAIDLKDWIFSDGSSIAKLPSVILLPQQYLILCAATNKTSYENFGMTLGVTSFASLNNSGESLVLKDNMSKTIDSVNYNLTTYNDNEKNDGGWSLERIDPDDFCSEQANWSASVDSIGGSPGIQNSIYPHEPDVFPLKLLSANVVSPDTVIFLFDKRLHEELPASSEINISPYHDVSSIGFSSVDRFGYRVAFTTGLDSMSNYSIVLDSIFDCGSKLIQAPFNALTFRLDSIAPSVDSVLVLSNNSLRVYFSEKLEINTLTTSANFHVPGLGNPDSIHVDEGIRSAQVFFGEHFTNGVEYILDVQGLADNATNEIDPQSVAFRFFVSMPTSSKDVLISEIFADPTPTMGLPEHEFIELYNRSENAIDLKDWIFTDGSTMAKLPNVILMPQQYLILCATTNKSSYESFGTTLGVTSFPSLNNSGESLVLKDELGKAIDSVSYNLSTYQDNEKNDGGWSLERIDPEDFCSGEANWSASVDSIGGSPGIQNSIYAHEPDVLPLKLLSANVVSADTMIFLFDKRLDEELPALSEINISPYHDVSSIGFSSEDRFGYRVAFITGLDSMSNYSIVLDSIFDCGSNLIQAPFNALTFRLDSIAPSVDSVLVLSNNSLRVYFSEKLEINTLTTPANFHVPGLGNPDSIHVDEGIRSAQLFFGEHFTNGVEYILDVQGLADNATNEIDPQSVAFRFFVSTPTSSKDVLISEIFADPTPTIGLPEHEFVELFNRSKNAIDLKDWVFTDGSTMAKLPGVILLPQQYLILCATTNKESYESFGTTLGLTTFPSLNNSGESLVLKDKDLKIMDSVNYNLTTYHDNEKNDGGWSLERIDPDDFCSEQANWSASVDSIGGSPGIQNSIYAHEPDVFPLKLLSANVVSADTMIFLFDKRLHEDLPALSEINILPYHDVSIINFSSVDHFGYQVVFATGLDSMSNYSIVLDSIFDCGSKLIQAPFNALTFRLDSIAPSVDSVLVLSNNSLRVYFSEKLRTNTLASPSNFHVLGLGNPDSIYVDEGIRSARLFFDEYFTNGVEYILDVQGVADNATNEIGPQSVAFRFFVSSLTSFKDVIISEIFADPTPRIGLPEHEFVELFNRSDNAIDLKDWIFSDGSSIAKLPSVILLPQQYLILCAATNKVSYEIFGMTVGVTGFPSLNNSGESLFLNDHLGKTIDSVNYSLSTYNDNEKKDGGYSLEILNPFNDCEAEGNWSSSVNSMGGTPGAQNSIFLVEHDLTGPKLLSAALFSPTEIVVQFNERLNHNLPHKNEIVSQPPLDVDTLLFVDASLSAIRVLLHTSIDSALLYHVTTTGIYDCSGNIIQQDFNTVSVKLDDLSPTIVSVDVISDREIVIVFSEIISATTAEQTNNFDLQSGVNSISTVDVLADQRSVKLTFDQVFLNGLEYVLLVRNISDRSGNSLMESEVPFTYFIHQESFFKDLVITEIFADPSPSHGLPDGEFIEIFNRSNHPVDVSGWSLSDGSTLAILMKGIILPGGHLILCASAYHEVFSAFGSSMGLSPFPALNNSGDFVILKDGNNRLIDSLHYSTSWFRDDDKKDGGWSLELIDPENICAEEENWISSEDQKGGTPGAKNSVDAEMPDLTGPKLLLAVANTPAEIILTYDEKLSPTPPAIGDIHVEPSTTILSSSFFESSQRKVQVGLEGVLANGVLYEITVEEIRDCAGNEISEENMTVHFAIPEEAILGDIIINEILVNPRPSAVDFVELYNTSPKFINLKNWMLANVDGEKISNKRIITNDDYLLAPDAYVVATANGDILKGEYISSDENAFIKAQLPSYPDDDGTVVLLRGDSTVMDSLRYDRSMHSPLIKDEEGVSLERISVDVATNEKSNWRSASSTVGFATPGYANSNARQSFTTTDAVSVEPEIISPSSGQAEFATIHYQFEQGGFIANVNIVDAHGRQIKRLANNELLGVDGVFRWDGDQDSGGKARIGAYMILFEIFNLAGKANTIRKRIVVTGKF